MDDLFGPVLLSAVFVMAFGLYRLTHRALAVMAALEQRLLMGPAAEPGDPRLDALAAQMTRLAQSQEALVKLLSDRTDRPRTPSQGVPSPAH